MKKWYSFYALAEDSDDPIQAVDNKFNFDSIKLQQIGEEIKEDDRREKLHQVGAEMVFPAFLVLYRGVIMWRLLQNVNLWQRRYFTFRIR